MRKPSPSSRAWLLITQESPYEGWKADSGRRVKTLVPALGKGNACQERMSYGESYSYSQVLVLSYQWLAIRAWGNPTTQTFCPAISLFIACVMNIHTQISGSP